MGTSPHVQRSTGSGGIDINRCMLRAVERATSEDLNALASKIWHDHLREDAVSQSVNVTNP